MKMGRVRVEPSIFASLPRRTFSSASILIGNNIHAYPRIISFIAKPRIFGLFVESSKVQNKKLIKKFIQRTRCNINKFIQVALSFAHCWPICCGICKYTYFTEFERLEFSHFNKNFNVSKILSYC